MACQTLAITPLHERSSSRAACSQHCHPPALEGHCQKAANAEATPLAGSAPAEQKRGKPGNLVEARS